MSLSIRELAIDIASAVGIIYALAILFQSELPPLQIPENNAFGWGAVIVVVGGLLYLEYKINKVLSKEAET